MHNSETALPFSPLQAFAGVVATRYYTEVTNAFMLSKGETKELKNLSEVLPVLACLLFQIP